MKKSIFFCCECGKLTTNPAKNEEGNSVCPNCGEYFSFDWYNIVPGERNFFNTDLYCSYSYSEILKQFEENKEELEEDGITSVEEYIDMLTDMGGWGYEIDMEEIDQFLAENHMTYDDLPNDSNTPKELIKPEEEKPAVKNDELYDLVNYSFYYDILNMQATINKLGTQGIDCSAIKEAVNTLIAFRDNLSSTVKLC